MKIRYFFIILKRSHLKDMQNMSISKYLTKKGKVPMFLHFFYTAPPLQRSLGQIRHIFFRC